jgi:hypothetical protein
MPASGGSQITDMLDHVRFPANVNKSGFYATGGDGGSLTNYAIRRIGDGAIAANTTEEQRTVIYSVSFIELMLADSCVLIDTNGNPAIKAYFTKGVNGYSVLSSEFGNSTFYETLKSTLSNNTNYNNSAAIAESAKKTHEKLMKCDTLWARELRDTYTNILTVTNQLPSINNIIDIFMNGVKESVSISSDDINSAIATVGVVNSLKLIVPPWLASMVSSFAVMRRSEESTKDWILRGLLIGIGVNWSMSMFINHASIILPELIPVASTLTNHVTSLVIYFAITFSKLPRKTNNEILRHLVPLDAGNDGMVTYSKIITFNAAHACITALGHYVTNEWKVSDMNDENLYYVVMIRIFMRYYALTCNIYFYANFIASRLEHRRYTQEDVRWGR